MQFSYLAYLHHSAKLQKMVLDAGAQVLPAMMQEARDTFGKEDEMPSFDTFFKTYMDRLENAIVETMHTEEYTITQNEVLASGAKSKMIYDEMLESIFKDWPFMTKREADDLAKETSQLRRRVRDLEARMSKGATPVNGAANKAAPKAAPKAATKSTPKAAAPKVAPDMASAEGVINKIGSAPKGASDDLKEIKGVGTKLENLLKEMGVSTFKQVAKMDDEVYTMIDELIPAFKGRAKRDKWAVQAKQLLKASTLV